MNELTPNRADSPARSGIRGMHIFLIVIATILITVALTFWFVRSYIYAADFTPVQLQQSEQQELNRKLKVLGYEAAPATDTAAQKQPQESDQQWLRPEAYSEAGSQREVSFSERELNAIIANNPDLARKLAIDLSDKLISARLLIPMDPDFPILGGKTLRVSAGVEMAFRDSRPIVILKGVSLMGIPIPAAWLGGLKNIDLISEYGDEGGFWAGFADGVENIEVRQQHLRVKLKP